MSDPNTSTSEDTFDLLSQDDDTPDEEVIKEEEVEVEEEIEEETLKEASDENLEEEPEIKEENEIEDQISGFNKSKFNKEFPGALKKFPQLERAYYANRAYREVFPTLDDAKQAAEKVEELEKHISSFNEGKSSLLLKELKEKNPDNFPKIVNNYLKELHEVDESAFYHVIENVWSEGLTAFFNAGKTANNEEVMEAARMFKAFLFQDKDVVPGKEFKPKNVEVSKIDEERKQWNTQKLNDFNTEIQDKVSSTLESLIKINIDPKDQLTAFAKKSAIREARELVDKSIKSDNGFQALIKKMTQKAQESGLSQESKNRIRSAYDSKAKSLLPIILRKVRTEALSGTSSKQNGVTRQKTLAPSSHSAGNTPQRGSNKTPDGRNKSTLDILNED